MYESGSLESIFSLSKIGKEEELKREKMKREREMRERGRN